MHNNKTQLEYIKKYNKFVDSDNNSFKNYNKNENFCN